ncbi:hypothetical protein [Frigoribacterium sp. CFBP 13707]|uniref:hypothetical protein n=1 Tax=Frigoribacterium sp. CFBP 13707 TaxID=2775313 RepID=UPI00177B4A6B|nr:hypothetical protein [Frigoribacterium sp. CFBP 13707]MBD8729144.1 hypothetical protein [Frigoribacterium sp. CFBP 13707]
MSRPTPRLARLAAWIAIPAALVASGLVVSQASYSAFSSTTANPTSNWTAGSVALTDDDGGTTADGSTGAAMFQATNLKPGSTGSKCIAVTSTGSLASAVKLYSSSYSTTKALGDNITLNITQGTGGGFGSCTGYTPAQGAAGAVYSGTVAGLSTAATNYGNGVGTWATVGGTTPEVRTYQVTYTVNSAATNAQQGGTAAIALTWEAQNS